MKRAPTNIVWTKTTSWRRCDRAESSFARDAGNAKYRWIVREAAHATTADRGTPTGTAEKGTRSSGDADENREMRKKAKQTGMAVCMVVCMAVCGKDNWKTKSCRRT